MFTFEKDAHNNYGYQQHLYRVRVKHSSSVEREQGCGSYLWLTVIADNEDEAKNVAERYMRDTDYINDMDALVVATTVELANVVESVVKGNLKTIWVRGDNA